MGEADRAPTLMEMSALEDYVRRGMQQGALGLSTGLFYVPGTYAETSEVTALNAIAAEYGGIYDTHDRDLGAVYNGIGYDASVREAIEIGERAGTPVIFSHFNPQGARNYGRASVGIQLIEQARARGVDVMAAQHVYTATQSNLRSYALPPWVAAGGRDAMLRRFDDPDIVARLNTETMEMLSIRGGAEKILFADQRPELNGRTLAQVASNWQLSIPQTVRRIMSEGNASVMNLELYDHQNTRRLAQEAWMMTCTDGRTPRADERATHPRTFGAFPKKMRHFVFEEDLLTPEFVIRSFSGLAADFYGLADRGYLREGYVAELVVIDPDRYRDLATFENPKLMSEGVVHLMVNGRFAIRDGEMTGELAGVPLSLAANQD